MLDNMLAAFGTNKPSIWFEEAWDSDNFAWVFRELCALKGRRQPPQWHPEGDCWVHSMQVLDRAKELGASTLELFGALSHDLGKAITESFEPKWQHLNHEALGIPLVKSLGERLGVDETFIEFGQVCSKYHLHVHRLNELRTVKRVDLVLNTWPWTKSLGLVSQADAQGRGPELREKPYPQRELLNNIVEKFEASAWVYQNESLEMKRSRMTRVLEFSGLGK